MSSEFLNGTAFGFMACSYYMLFIGSANFKLESLLTWLMLALTAVLMSVIKTLDKKKETE